MTNSWAWRTCTSPLVTTPGRITFDWLNFLISSFASLYSRTSSSEDRFLNHICGYFEKITWDENKYELKSCWNKADDLFDTKTTTFTFWYFCRFYPSVEEDEEDPSENEPATEATDEATASQAEKVSKKVSKEDSEQESVKNLEQDSPPEVAEDPAQKEQRSVLRL